MVFQTKSQAKNVYIELPPRVIEVALRFLEGVFGDGPMDVPADIAVNMVLFQGGDSTIGSPPGGGFGHQA